EGWNGPFVNRTWTLQGHYWICNQHAYRRLPPNWSGICYVGYIRPLFFLLPQIQVNQLEIKVYNNAIREKQSIHASLAGESIQKWRKDEWPHERIILNFLQCQALLFPYIIQHYGPATWNPNELISGAREPIYNLNQMIRLKAVFKIITNQTATALDLLANQSTQMRNATFHHGMVSDYLLAEEGETLGKLNYSNCPLQMDDNGKMVTQITKGIRKLAHIPV
ncbi:ENR1 protein, partial [Cnemophilus loriae]|nr:ENR1 protein [Cnemophilus loriae]